jgi:SAM-dependent methyltransferase
MKVNLGSGYKRIEGFVNVDDDPLVNPEYVVNLEKGKLPFDDNTVEEVVAHHILEHIGEGFIPLMQEIYRVCKNGAIIDIVAPHHFHEVYVSDPTHKRPITVDGMMLLGKKFNREHIEKHTSSSGLGLKFNIDFEVIWYDYDFDVFYDAMITDFKKRKEEGKVAQEEDFMIQRLLREATNVAINTKIKLMVKKDGPTA